MAAPVGSLIVRVGSDVRGLVVGLRRGGAGLSRFGRIAQGAAQRIAIIGASALAAGALIRKFASEGFGAVDSMAKFARAVGVSTERLAGLQFAAQQTSGFTERQFNLAFQRATRRIAEAAQGTGEAKGAIERLGLSAKELAKAGPDEAFLLIADAMQNVEDQGERLRIGMKFFDSEGARLVNTLGAGREEIERLVRQADKLGLAFSEVDARKVEAANDAMARLFAIMQGLSRQLAIKLAPFIEEVADRLQQMAISGGNVGERMESGLGGAIRAAGFFADLWRFIQIGVKSVALLIQKIWAGFLSGVDSAARAWNIFESSMRRGLNEIIDALNKLPGVEIEKVEVVSRRFQGLKQQSEVAAIGVELLTTELANLMKQPLPSKAVEEFLDSVKRRSEEAAAAAAEAGGTPEPDSDPKDFGEGAEKELRRKELESRLEQIRTGLLSEREVEQEAFEQRMRDLKKGLEQKQLTEEQFRRQTEQAERQHQEKLAQIEFQSRQERARKMATQFDAIASLTAGLNATLFKNSKAGAIAESVILGIAGAIRTWNAYPWPWNILPTAAHIAGTAARISQIKSQNFSSGGGTVAPSIAAAGAGAVPVVAAAGGAGGGIASGTTVNIALQGDRFGREQVRALIGQINDAVADGARIRVR